VENGIYTFYPEERRPENTVDFGMNTGKSDLVLCE
jgi:hypothetical protein